MDENNQTGVVVLGDEEGQVLILCSSMVEHLVVVAGSNPDWTKVKYESSQCGQRDLHDHNNINTIFVQGMRTVKICVYSSSDLTVH